MTALLSLANKTFNASCLVYWCQCAGIGFFFFDNTVFSLGDDLLQSPSIAEDSNICTLALFRSFILSFISHKMQSHAFIWKQHSSISVMCCISAGWPLILYCLSYDIVGLVGLISIDFAGILHELISGQLVKITVWFLGIQRSSWQQHNYNCGK